jgi:hypothetical protein
MIPVGRLRPFGAARDGEALLPFRKAPPPPWGETDFSSEQEFLNFKAVLLVGRETLDRGQGERSDLLQLLFPGQGLGRRRIGGRVGFSIVETFGGVGHGYHPSQVEKGIRSRPAGTTHSF